MVTPAKRKSNNKWDAENMVVLGCKVKREVAEAFKRECANRGTSPNAVFRDAIDSFMSRTGQDN